MIFVITVLLATAQAAQEDNRAPERKKLLEYFQADWLVYWRLFKSQEKYQDKFRTSVEELLQNDAVRVNPVRVAVIQLSKPRTETYIFSKKFKKKYNNPTHNYLRTENTRMMFVESKSEKEFFMIFGDKEALTPENLNLKHETVVIKRCKNTLMTFFKMEVVRNNSWSVMKYTNMWDNQEWECVVGFPTTHVFIDEATTMFKHIRELEEVKKTKKKIRLRNLSI